ncbi:hypothetical protein ACOYW6_11735 [Parablastomonas sp. CN1-191]|uniref:hypothetical protein n=1 Tax=Parablastomonas sp. CN1-191 TaxID=3400908 RepID=UPI003BF846B9
MKTWPKPAQPAPLSLRRLPAFHPVPVGPRKDGWTIDRQAKLIGFIAETRSVIEACRRVGMGRESAYRLRARPGGAGLAAAWDAALGKPHRPVDLASAKSTGLPAHYRWRAGRIAVVTVDGTFAGYHRKDDDCALLQHLAQLDRGAGEQE